MVLEFPRMVYRVGTMAVLMSGTYDHKLVNDAEDLKASQAEGWCLDEDAAKESHAAAAEAVVKAADEPAAPAKGKKAAAAEAATGGA